MFAIYERVNGLGKEIVLAGFFSDSQAQAEIDRVVKEVPNDYFTQKGTEWFVDEWIPQTEWQRKMSVLVSDNEKTAR